MWHPSDRAIELGLHHHRAGRFIEAEAAYRQVLSHDPQNADALHLLGVLSHQLGRGDIAEDFIRAAIAVKPDAHEFHANLGEALRTAGKLDEAVDCFVRAISLDPEYADAYLNLGIARRQLNQLPEAEFALRRAIDLQPLLVRAYSNLAAIYTQVGRHDRAAEVLTQAASVDPSSAETHMHLAAALKETGRLEAATAEARRATQLAPTSPETHQQLGIILQSANRLDEAIESFGKAIELKPTYADAWNNLGFCLLTLESLDDAVAALREALRFAPNSPPTLANLANALIKQGQIHEAIGLYRHAIALRPDMRTAHANLLLAMNYDDAIDPKTIFNEHTRWAQQHAAPIRVLGPALDHDRNPNRRLRIGYVSPDFRQHSVAYFIEPLLRHHNRDAFEIVCYSDVATPDAVTNRLRALADRWHDVHSQTDEALAAQIRADAIDILIDLAGHTASNRLLTFARKPAPVQIAYLGYPNTTALPAMDFRLTDLHADPPGMTDAHFTERLLRLPACAWCYSPDDACPPVAAPPSDSAGHVTFGSFNKLQKISPTTMRMWARLLAEVAGSRLMIKSPILHDESARRLLKQSFEQLGVAADRIELIGRSRAMAEHLHHYERVDVALDTTPYNGTTTTCDALWMGVPVVTLAGDRHIARVGVSLLRSAGLGELVTTSADQYIAAAAALARDTARRRSLRSGLRKQLKSSPLMDAKRFAGAVESALRNAWTQPLTRSATIPSAPK